MGVLMADHGVPVPLALADRVPAGRGGRLLNGVLVVLTRINGFIVTLATMTILLGLQYRVVGTRDGRRWVRRDWRRFGTMAALYGSR